MRHPACDDRDRDRVVFPPGRRVAVMITLGVQVVAMIIFSVVWFV